MRRITDAAEANALAGLDLSEFMAEPMHVCLEHEGSGALFAFRGPGIFEVHVFFNARGRDALRVGHAMLDHIRAGYGGRVFWSLIPLESRRVKMFARLMGWKSLGVRQTRHGPNELFVEESGLNLIGNLSG